jgi:hypothetical protein
MNLHPVTSIRAYSPCRVPNLARSSASPNREQLTAGVEQGQRPRDEDLQRRDCPRDHHGGRRAQQSRDLRSPAAHHAHPVTNRKSPLNFLEKAGATPHGFDEVDIEVGTSQRDGDTRKSRTAAQVADAPPDRDQICHRGTVQDVTLP